MQIFVGNLSPDATPQRLQQLFEGVGRYSGFKVRHKRLKDGQIRTYAYGVIVPDKAAERVLERCREAKLDGRPLEIRPFFHRAYANERRVFDWGHPWDGPDRRTGERRNSS